MNWKKYPENKPLGNIKALVVFNDSQCPYPSDYFDNKWWHETYCHEEMPDEEVNKITHFIDVEDIPLPE